MVGTFQEDVMAVGSVTKESIDASYARATQYESEAEIRGPVVKYLNLIFMISQADEVRSPSDFFSGRNLPIVEAFEDLNASYELAKMGLYKHAFISLRVGFDNGLVAAYWKAVGNESKEFHRWLNSKEPTPQKTRKFWETIMSIDRVSEFAGAFPLESEVKELDTLNDYVHTRGANFATLTEFQRRIKSGNENVHFDQWWGDFQRVARLIVILQLLVNPKLTANISVDVLLRKFGTFRKIPFMGSLLGDNSDTISAVVGIAEYNKITELCAKTDQLKEVLDFVEQLPDLDDEEIRDMILEEQKAQILDSGFGRWLENRHLYDHRIDQATIVKLQAWVELLKSKG